MQFGDPLVPQRIWNRITIHPNGCWHWTGLVNREGYGRAKSPTRRSASAGRLEPDFVYRIIWDAMAGPVDATTSQHDHQCHNRDRLACPGGPTCQRRRCVNPQHIERRTPRVNVLAGNGPTAMHARQTHCVNGHEFTPANTYVRPSKPNTRACRRCKADRQAKRYNHLMDTSREFHLAENRRHRQRRRKAA